MIGIIPLISNYIWILLCIPRWDYLFNIALSLCFISVATDDPEHEAFFSVDLSVCTRC